MASSAPAVQSATATRAIERVVLETESQVELPVEEPHEKTAMCDATADAAPVYGRIDAGEDPSPNIDKDAFANVRSQFPCPEYSPATRVTLQIATIELHLVDNV